METFALPSEANGQLRQEKRAIRRPKFPSALLEREKDKFIDPAAEAAVLLPEKTSVMAPISLALEVPLQTENTRVDRQNPVSALYELLASWWAAIKKRFARRIRGRARLTRQGKQALEQLRYISLLCDATEARTPEEILEAEGAFGEAYFEIMTLSSNLERMAQKEEEHHVRRYGRHMAALLQATP